MIGQEWRIVAREPAFRWSWLLLGLLVALCLWNGGRFAADRTAQARAEVSRSVAKRTADEAVLRREAAGTVPPNPFGPGEPTKAEWIAARPPGPLAALSFGREDLQPLSATVSLWMVRMDNLFRKYEFGSPVALAAGRFDAGFLVILLLPLFILASGYDLVAAERESGRLRLALVQGRSVGHRLARRLALRLLPAFGAVLAAGLVGLAWGLPAGRLGLWVAGAVLYLLFWAGIAAAIAALRWRQEALALAAAGCWLLLVVLLPAVTGAAAELAGASASPFALITQSRQAAIAADNDANDNLRRYASDHPDMMTGGGPAAGFTARMYVSQQVVERKVMPVAAAQAERDRRRDRWAAGLSILSPATTADQLLVGTAGTGRERQQAFEDQARSFLRRWRDALTPAVFHGRRLAAGDLARLPRFAFREPGLPPTVVPSLLWLGLLAVASLALGFRSLDRIERGGADPAA